VLNARVRKRAPSARRGELRDSTRSATGVHRCRTGDYRTPGVNQGFCLSWAMVTGPPVARQHNGIAREREKLLRIDARMAPADRHPAHRSCRSPDKTVCPRRRGLPAGAS
jgi:hypothetical protein